MKAFARFLALVCCEAFSELPGAANDALANSYALAYAGREGLR